MPYIVGFLSTLDAAHFDYLRACFQSQLATEVSPRPCTRWGNNIPGDLTANEVFVCTRWANGDYTQLAGPAGMAQQLLDAGCALIAAVGGIVSALAAESRTSTVPVIFFSGRHSSEESDNHKSNSRGIHLETTRYAIENTLRHKKLRNLFSLNNNAIFNLVFRNSVVHNDEKDWTNHVIVADTTDQALTDAFNAILGHGAAARGLTISADAYFFTRMADIVTFANNQFAPKPVIYPFRGWVQGGGLMSCGPNLCEMYKALGSWAAYIIVHNTSGNQLSSLPAKTLVTEFVVNHATAVAQLGAREAARIEAGAIVI
jgi:hypothetical protein